MTGRVSDNPADSLRRELDERQLGWLVGAAINKWQRGGPLTISEHVARDLWPTLRAWAEAARADERERLKAALRQIHWVTVYASGKFEGSPCCGCCSWLDGVRRPWPCGTLQAVGFTDDDIPAELRGGV